MGTDNYKVREHYTHRGRNEDFQEVQPNGALKACTRRWTGVPGNTQCLKHYRKFIKASITCSYKTSR